MTQNHNSVGLLRGLSTWDSAAVVVGTIIGTGIFLKTTAMAQLLGSPIWVLVAWIVAGLLSYAGALCYAELSSRYPEAGGEYAYLRHGYGNGIAFLYGWTRFLIAGPGSTAAYAVGAATFLGGAFEISLGLRTMVAIGFIVFFAVLNCIRVKTSGRIQTALTLIKLLLVLALVMGILLFGETAQMGSVFSSPDGHSFPGMSAFGAALLAALWAYDGWNNLPMVGSEVQNPQVAIPRALGLGLLVVILTYVITNVAYLVALPWGTVLSGNSTQFPEALPVATLAAQSFLGTSAVAVMSIIFTVSALGAMHGSVLTGARVPYAMARDGLFFQKLSFLNSHSHAPVISVLAQASVAIGLALIGSFDQLTDSVVFASFVFYLLNAILILKLRKSEKEKPAGQFRTPWYPVLPLVFIFVSAWLLASTVISDPRGSLLGVGIIALGIPVYKFYAGAAR
ncbi:MAG: APC family permease [Bdellovibrionales bacterium]